MTVLGVTSRAGEDAMLTVITFRPESLLLIMRLIVVMAIRPYRSTFNSMLLAFWDM
jgi:hypothetical protein